VLGQDLGVEVVDHDLGLEPNSVPVALNVGPQLLRRSPGVELRVVLNGLDQLVVAVDRHVVGQDVDDEAFLDRLLHRVDVERTMRRLPGIVVGRAEDFQRLVLRGRGERKVTGVGQHLLGFHEPVDLVLNGVVLLETPHG
jgi:hypothetical protein